MKYINIYDLNELNCVYDIFDDIFVCYEWIKRREYENDWCQHVFILFIFLHRLNKQYKITPIIQ